MPSLQTKPRSARAAKATLEKPVHVRDKPSAEGTGALEKALDVLEAVGQSQHGLSQTDIAQSLNIPRTTVYRLLAALVSRGLLRRDSMRRVYCLGFKCFELARQAYANPDLVAAASTELRSLRDLTGETTYLAAQDGMEVVAVERFDGAHSERSASQLGQRKPMHCTSQGKAILASLPSDQRERLIRELPLKALTVQTITDRRRLATEIKLTAARGWSIDEEEIVAGVRCVGAAIVDSQGMVRGAISVAGPAWRLTRERVQLLGPEVMEAARRIGAQLRQTISLAADQAVQVLPTQVAAHNAPRSAAYAGAFHGAFPCYAPNRSGHQTPMLAWADRLAPALFLWNGKSSQLLTPLEQPVHGLAAYPSKALSENAQSKFSAKKQIDPTWIVAYERSAQWVNGSGKRSPVAHWPEERIFAMCSDWVGDWTADWNHEKQSTIAPLLWLAIEQSHGKNAQASAHCAMVSFSPISGKRQTHWVFQEPIDCLHWHNGQLYAIAKLSGSLMILKPGQTSVQRLATLPPGSGSPSGLAVDEEGGVWTTLVGGWGVVRIGADGHLDRVIGLPVPSPVDLVLERDAKNDLRATHLIVTTARQGVALDVLANAPLSGQLLRIPLG